MDGDKAPAEYNAGVDWLHTFSYRESRTSVTSEHINDIDNAIINVIKYINIANCASNELAVQSPIR